ncbi:translation initiation factor IF-3 [Paenibacillus sp. ATY16]|uniref:translation initiation factor IF-3 n=1 Tax=Paenibacillus sp. ATY16 TaxID=1759312 RepID=UPI00200DB861|nr:translation initiation factor IF-3 [Paenibacillus sp. ATY16]MCK9861952.1 translation initiation factor IF-3 [Paenibacillus sp. ATY16]
MLIMNEKIKAAEVRLTGLDGESLGIVSRDEALQMAKQLKVDLVCESLMSSPPPCKLIVRGGAKQQASQQKRAEKMKDQPAKVKELRLSVDIEQHDYDTKLRQAVKMLESGNAVQLVIRIQGKEGARAKELLEQLLADLKPYGTKQSGIQLSGKQAAVQVNPN